MSAMSNAIIEAAAYLTAICHGAARHAGWHNHGKGLGAPLTKDEQTARNPERFMLIVTEVAEAMEGHRKSKMDDHLPHRTSVEVELADALIRIFDLAGALELDIGAAMAEKMAYNAQRADHKPENRAAGGGKSC